MFGISGRCGHVKSRKLAMLAGAALAVGAVVAPTPAHAFFRDIERGVANLGKAAADVITLGEEGRRRDRERAENARREAEAAAASAAREKAVRAAGLRDQITILERVVANIDTNSALVADVTSLHDQIIKLGQEELARRKTADAQIERAADASRSAQRELTGLVGALDSLQFLDEQLLRSVNAPDSALVDAEKQARERALAAARQLIRTADLDNVSAGVYLDRAVKSLKTENLNTLVQMSANAQARLATVRANIVAQRSSFGNQLEGKRRELAALG
jgi:hypothetical protein